MPIPSDNTFKPIDLKAQANKAVTMFSSAQALIQHWQKAFLLLLMSLCDQAATGTTPLSIDIPTAGILSSPTPLKAYLFEPEGKAPHPAVIMLHGCGGAYARSGELNARHQMWGEYLASQGFAALMLDSFSSRGVKELCTTRIKDRSLKEADRVGDAYAALAYLQTRDDIQAKAVGLLGWSHGGGVTLDAMTRPPNGVAVQGGGVLLPRLHRMPAQGRTGFFTPYAPLLILIGDNDDWTPAAPCKALVATVAARHEPMQIITFADTFHDFDNPALKTKRVRTDVPNGVNPGSGVTVAPNPEAREAAKGHVLRFFSEHLK
ncbi:MAG: dienelactone hydrolase family protein [Betaproteobacteria bacterium]|nr:dienelactone hydrolase family protein [Betaproteobacteria bacterium]